MTCYHPDCDEDAGERYTDGWGNEIELCRSHYFEAVVGPTRISSVVRSSSNDERPESLFRRFFT